MLITIEEITQYHNRKAFDCGVTELNQFIQRQARQKTAKNISKTYVAVQDSALDVIIGYYTLTGIPSSHHQRIGIIKNILTRSVR